MASSIDELLQDPAFRAKFLELLDRDPAFREEVRRKLLSEELLALPERLEQFRREMEEAIARLRQEMNEQFRRVWEVIEQNNRQIAALTVRMEKVEEQIAENSRQIAALTVRMEKVEEQIAALTVRMEKVEEQIAALTVRMEKVEEQIAENSRQIAALTVRMEKVEEQIAALTVRMERVEEQIAENSRQIAALTVRMEKVEEQLKVHTEELRGISQIVGRMQERWGLLHEDLAEDQMPYILERSQRIVRRIAKVQYDGEVDLVLEVEEANGFRFTLVLEVKGRVFSARPFEQVLQRLTDSDFLNWLRREGFPEPYVPAVFAMALYGRVETLAQDFGVGLYDPKRGEIFIPPLSTSA